MASMGSRVDRRLGDRRVRYRETWTSALGREALVSEVMHRLVRLGGSPTSEGAFRLTARTGSYWATAWTVNARWPMQWRIELSDADPPVVTVEIVDALPSRVRAGSQRLYLKAIRKATDGLRKDLTTNAPR
jgi:hypothetical protein